MISAKREIEEYLIDRYDLVKLSYAARNKLEELYKPGIEPKHLLTLFRIMEDLLNQIRAKNIAKGKKLEYNHLLMYDLAIIMDYYPKYIRTIHEFEKQDNERNDFVELSKMVKDIPSNHKEDALSDVSSIVQELFF